MERPVRPLRAARCARADARASRAAVRRRGIRHERAPDRPRDAGGAGRPRRLRQWPDADISGLGRGRADLRRPRRDRPHRDADGARGRSGRAAARSLFTLDAELQRADVAMREAAVNNAQQAYDRAATLLKSAVRHAEGARRCRGRAAHRAGAAQLRADPAGAPQGVQPGRRHASSRSISAAARLVPAGRPIVAILPPGNLKVRFFVNEATLPQAHARRHRHHPVRRLRRAISPRKISFISRTVRIHAAGDLQPGGALQARVPDRGAAGAAGAACASASRSASPWGRNSDQRIRDGARDRHRRPRPDQVLRRPQGRARPLDAGQARHDLRLPRPQRLRQDHDHPHAVRAAHARRGRGHLPRLRHPHRGRRDQAPCRLHDAALQPLSGPLGAREPGIRRAALRHCRSRSRRRAR